MRTMKTDTYADGSPRHKDPIALKPEPQVDFSVQQLKPCPFCGNDAITFEPDEDRNIVSCKLGHAPMRTIEGWNTRAIASEFSVAQLIRLRTAILTVLDDGTNCGNPACQAIHTRPWAFYAPNWREDTDESTAERMEFLKVVQKLLT